uniref:Uncharacterized protein n=1 Tax=Anopheles atroparvus TaxID=41427 RepID=A0AAG5DVM1_ANOAO
MLRSLKIPALLRGLRFASSNVARATVNMGMRRKTDNKLDRAAAFR